MIYECEQCDAVLPAGATACPQCGEKFEEAVPEDAESPFAAPAPSLPVSPGLPAPGLPLPVPPRPAPEVTGRRTVQELMNKHRERFKIDAETLRQLEEAEGEEREAEPEEP